MRRLLLLCWLACVLSVGAAAARAADFGLFGKPSSSPAKVEAVLSARDELTVRFTISPGIHVYKDEIKLSLPEGVRAELLDGGRPGVDKDTGAAVYTGSARQVYKLLGALPDPLPLGVTYQGCNDTTCFLPVTANFSLPLPGGAPGTESPARADNPASGAAKPDAAGAQEWETLADSFKTARTATGYQNAEKFRAWLRGEGEAGVGAFLDRILGGYGLWAVALLLLPLGALLNLTPCVLPMVPITLGILGAAKNAEKRGRGFTLGALYGAGMALVYGILGLFVVLTGSRFGELNSTAWFNFAVAGVFVALALAMFDIWTLDFTGFSRVKVDNKKSPFLGAFLLGGLTALLAGACVAPVLVWVLLLAADLYVQGSAAGLALPFLLGAGMALPWPFLAAGVSKLPRPGAWMKRVKQAFGVLILFAAAGYAFLGVRLLPASGDVSAAVDGRAALPGWHSSLPEAMRAALASGRPLLVDFSGLACKACALMKATTLVDPAVKAELEKFEKVEFMADGADPLTARAVRKYGVVGLPTYIILEKK